MTTATTELCRYQWTTQATPDSGYSHHECREPANHPKPCRCYRCGATTTRPEGEQMSEIPDAVEEVQRRVGSFADEMREKGIHVGINGRCVCGMPWPCNGSDTVATGQSEATR